MPTSKRRAVAAALDQRLLPRQAATANSPYPLVAGVDINAGLYGSAQVRLGGGTNGSNRFAPAEVRACISVYIQRRPGSAPGPEWGCYSRASWRVAPCPRTSAR